MSGGRRCDRGLDAGHGTSVCGRGGSGRRRGTRPLRCCGPADGPSPIRRLRSHRQVSYRVSMSLAYEAALFVAEPSLRDMYWVRPNVGYIVTMHVASVLQRAPHDLATSVADC